MMKAIICTYGVLFWLVTLAVGTLVGTLTVLVVTGDLTLLPSLVLNAEIVAGVVLASVLLDEWQKAIREADTRRVNHKRIDAIITKRKENNV